MRTSAAPRVWILGAACALVVVLGVVLGQPVIAAALAVAALALQALVVHRWEQRQLQDAQQQQGAIERLERELAAQGQAAGQTRTEFIAGMGHELRTPLNAILGYTELIKRGANLSQRQLEGLATVEHSGLKLLGLINDLLDLAKLEANQLELHPEPIRLADFAQEVGQMARTQAGAGTLGLAIEAPDELPQTVLVDSHRLRQVLMHLLSHAMRAADSGQAVLRLGSRPLEGAQARLVFDVQDVGLGAQSPPADSFKPFLPVADAQQRTGGSGLGLRISHALVRLMRGEILVSGVGPGVVWRLELPVPVMQAAPEGVDSPLDVVGYLGPRKSILIVDDVEMYRSLLASILGGLGFDTDEAANGQACLDRIAARTPDLVLMDLVMPVMDGLEAIRCIRMQPQWEDIPIAVISANCSERDRLRGLAAGAQAVMGKPVEPAVLLATVGKQLGLTWITGPSAEDGAAGVLPTAPPPEQLATLYQLALEGNMRKIRQFAEDLAGQGEALQPLAGQLRRMAADYQSRAILELVEQYMAREERR